MNPRNPSNSITRIRRTLGVMLMTTATLFSATPVFAQELTDPKPPKDRSQGNADDSPTRAELKKRFEARFDQVNALKDKGSIGETFDGYLEALDQRLLSRDERKLLEDENADRKALYSLIANRVDEGKEKVPPRVVAERNARRNFEKADSKQYLKLNDGRWIQKSDEDRADKIAKLKKDGVVGETFEGYLEAVKSNVDDDVKRLIEQENRDRRAMYDEIAGRIEKASAADIAREAAKSMKENLPPGESYKSKEGAWERRPSRQS